jgi:hypothetical protein
MRPSLTTGTPAEWVRTIAICKMTRNRRSMLCGLAESKLSAQSPAWSRKARPCATSASEADSCRVSPGITSGGAAASLSFTALSAASLSHSGCWPAGRSRQLDGLHAGLYTRLGLSVN